MVDVYLIRHSHVDYSPGMAITDRNPLTPLGLRLAELLADRCADWGLQYLFASTMLRARQTADAVARRLPDLPRRDMPELQETNIADLSGWPGEPPSEDLNTWQSAHYGHADRQMAERLGAGWREITGLIADQGLARVAVVSHGAAMNLLLRQFMGGISYDSDCWIEFDWTGVTLLQYGPEGRRIAWMNDARHIDPLRDDIAAFGRSG
jgi:probable phosphoglycerate mutase